MAKKSPDPPLSCCSCKRPVGAGSKQVPVFVDDDSGPHRPWCPTCFVFRRAPMEPGRWREVLPVQCGACGSTSTAFGIATCGSCSSRRVIIIVPSEALPGLLAEG